MKKTLFSLLVVASFVAAPLAFAEETARKEMTEHPRIEKAVHALEDAIAYMEHAPHDFGGHKAQAIADSRKAVEQLREAMKYRASQDNKAGKK